MKYGNENVKNYALTEEWKYIKCRVQSVSQIFWKQMIWLINQTQAEQQFAIKMTLKLIENNWNMTFNDHFRHYSDIIMTCCFA